MDIEEILVTWKVEESVFVYPLCISKNYLPGLEIY
jgi:hypothetical protein